MRGDSFEKIIPRARPKTGIWTNAIFYLCLIILGLLVIAFFFLNNEISIFENQKKIVESQILNLELEKQTKGKEILSLSRDIKLFKGLFAKHRLVSHFFPFFESIVHPKVYITQLTVSANDGQININGETENFKSMGEQILILKQQEDIEDITLSNLAFSDEGNVNFDLSFSFSNKLLKK